MKIGILTFHCAHNYGAVLQCYALQEILKEMGYDVEVIDYRPNYLTAPYKIFDSSRFYSKNPIKYLLKFIIEFLLIHIRKRRYKSFGDFILQRLNLSHSILEKMIPSNYNIYIIGSDQIWNPVITKGYDSVYFCKFPFEKGNKKYIVYAASSGQKNLSSLDEKFYKEALENFDLITVREKQLMNLLQPLTDKKIYNVIDPTLLANPELWHSLTKNRIRLKYVLVYQVRYNKRIISIANNIAKQIGGVVIELAANIGINIGKNVKQSASPEDFLNYIKNASFIVTTSFHGTAFSVIFERPFYCVRLNDGADLRSSSFLDSIGLSSRMIDIDEMPQPLNIEYKKISKSLNVLRKESLSILKESMKS